MLSKIFNQIAFYKVSKELFENGENTNYNLVSCAIDYIKEKKLNTTELCLTEYNRLKTIFEN